MHPSSASATPRTMLGFADSRSPIPDSRFPIPDSRFPIPDSRFPRCEHAAHILSRTHV
ncbi:hypothetical protein XAPC_2823 [Xanthomonas citri pv. punicae str. LMG 859]|nr:hypothetical protein XAPC_2823 [Xanthomonas citri pv. punicae str. LMG 859]